MAARAIWKGVLHIGKLKVPVKLYSAIEDKRVHFRLLEQSERDPVSQKMLDPQTGKKVDYKEAKKGYEVERGVFVILDEDDLEELEPKASRDINITRFVSPEAIDHRWYSRPYWLGPDGDEKSYFALAEALARKGKEGVARWVMRKKEYAGALRVEGEHLMLIALRWANEVVAAEDLTAPAGRKPDAKEIKLAEQLISALEDEFRPEDYRDEYRERVMELIETKAKGGKVKVRRFRPKVTEEDSLADALAASLSKAKGKKSA